MSDTRFRSAQAGDLPAIVALLADDAIGQAREDAAAPLSPGYLAAFEAIAADPNHLLAVAEDPAGAVIGCLQLSFIPGLSYKGMWRGQIEDVRIAADRRGQGHGRRFLEWALEACRARGCGMAQLVMTKQREGSRRFYQSMGFVVSHDGLKLSLDRDPGAG